MTEPGNPCFTFAGIAFIDEPVTAGVMTFGDGTVMLTFNLRDGGDLSQLMIGLTANQTIQLIERLQIHHDLCLRAIAEGKGGTQFPDLKEGQ